MRLVAVMLAASLTGCGSERPVASVSASPAIDQACAADKAQAYVGQRATPDLVETARNSAGARAVRTIAPGMMVTMDYRADRLNLTTDVQGRVVSVRCG